MVKTPVLTGGDVVSIPGQGNKIPQALRCSQKKKKKIDPPPGVKDFVTGPILQMGKTEAERGEFWPQNHTDCKWGDCNAVVGFPREEMKTSPGRVYVGQACRPSLAQQQDLNTDLACPFFHQPPQRADLV